MVRAPLKVLEKFFKTRPVKPVVPLSSAAVAPAATVVVFLPKFLKPSTNLT